MRTSEYFFRRVLWHLGQQPGVTDTMGCGFFWAGGFFAGGVVAEGLVTLAAAGFRLVDRFGAAVRFGFAVRLAFVLRLLAIVVSLHG